MKIFIKSLATIILAVVSLSTKSQNTSNILNQKFKNQPTVIVLRGVNIIPMDSNRVMKNKDIIIKSGKIHSITDNDQNKKYSDKTLLVDAKGKYLIPGLIDCHAHFYVQSDTWLFLAKGITSLRELSGTEELIAWRNDLKSKKMIGPDLFVSSPIIDGTADLGFEYVESMEDIDEIVQYCKSTRYDYLKIAHNFTLDQYSYLAKKCKSSKVMLVGHPPKDIPFNKIIEAGQFSVEHLLCLDLSTEAKLTEIANSKIWVWPTLGVYSKEAIFTNNAKNIEEYKYVHPSLLKEWKKYPPIYINDESSLKKLGQLWRKGARIVAGTDCRIEWLVQGFSLHQELVLMVENGMPTYEVLKSATSNAAECLDISKKCGTIAEGMTANLLLLNANPLENIQNTQKIEAVINKGMWFGSDDLDVIMKALEEERKTK